jgi:hypothetical protein
LRRFANVGCKRGRLVSGGSYATTPNRAVRKQSIRFFSPGLQVFQDLFESKAGLLRLWLGVASRMIA